MRKELKKVLIQFSCDMEECASWSYKEDKYYRKATTAILKLISELLPKEYTFKIVNWGDGFVSEEPVERDDICLIEAKSHNKALADVREKLG